MSQEEAFLELLSQHQRPLHKVCWVYTNNSHDRDDLLQEITSHLWFTFPRYDRARPFMTWMYRVALNVAIDFQRRKKRWGRAASGIDVEHLPAGHDADKADHLFELHELMLKLEEADRALLLLHLEGHDHRKIGDILGISESNVGTRLNRLKTALKQSAQEKD